MKKKLFSLALALALCLGLTVPAFAAEVKIVEVPVPTVEGYEVTPKYIGWSNFHDGLAMLWDSVGETGSMNYCYIDRTGKVVIPPAGYDHAVDFSEGMAAVVKNTKVGFIDTTGKEVIPCTYDEAYPSFSQGLVGVKKNGKWGFIDKTGELVIPCTFEAVGSFFEGMAAVVKNSKVGFIDQAGETVIDFQYDDTYGFSQGLAAVQKGGKWGYIDKTGETVIDFEYDEARFFSNGLAPVEQDGKWGCIDKTGELVIPCTFEAVGTFSEGLAPVAQNNKIGFIDKTGKLVVPCKYDNFAPFSEGFAAVGVTVGITTMWGIIDKTGKEVVTPTMHTEDGAEYFLNAFGSGPIFSEGYAVAHRSGEWKDLYEDRWFYFAITVDAEVSDWAREQVDLAAAKGLMPDVLGDDFTVNITRAEFAALSVELYEAMSGEEAPAPGDSPFTDTSDPVIIQANALGIVKGSGGKFRPDDLVSRQEAALMLSRVYTKLGGTIPQAGTTTFADDSKISPWTGLKDAIAFMSDNKIVTGKGNNTFDPLGNASIQEALIIALRMIENLDVE